MNIFITVNNQKLRCHNFNKYVSGTQKFILFNFILSDGWEELTIYAQFTQNEKSYNVFLDSNNCAYLPPEITEGSCKLALKGTKGDTTAISEPLELFFLTNPIDEKSAESCVTTTLYKQLVDTVNELKELVYSNQEKINLCLSLHPEITDSKAIEN